MSLQEKFKIKTWHQNLKKLKSHELSTRLNPIFTITKIQIHSLTFCQDSFIASTPSGPYLNRTRVFWIFLLRGIVKDFGKKNYNIRYFRFFKRHARPAVLDPDSFNFASSFIQSGSRIWVQFLLPKIEAKNYTWKKFSFLLSNWKNLSRSALRISTITLQPSRKHPALQSITFLKLFFYWIRNTVAKSLLVIDVADEAAGGFAWWQLLRSGLAQLQGPLQHAKI